MPKECTSTPLLLLCLGIAFLSSCRSTNQLLKAGPAELSAFVEHKEDMIDSRKKLPFHKIWKSPEAKVWEKAAKKTTIYIAPVTLAHLRPVKKKLAQGEVALGSVSRRETEMAGRLREAFIDVFKKAPRPRYLWTEKPGADSITLELALVELNPTSAASNAVKTGLGFILSPVLSGPLSAPLSQLGGIFTKGNVAIEGKVTNSKTGDLLMEFADNEADQMTIYSLRDYKAYGHAAHAIKNWARQFEQYIRKPPGKIMRDTAFFTLNPL